MHKREHFVDVSARAATGAEWDELIVAIADELTALGTERLEYELFARRLESEVRDLTGLRGLVSEDFVNDLLVRAQSLFRASQLPPSPPENLWADFDDESEVTQPATPRAIVRKQSGMQRIVIDESEEATRPGVPRHGLRGLRMVS